ncbi:hypothetical protein P7K49_031054 [Saguinus oedipus]|uniref:Uncharacterized protein n=1 Tax=Saguinus oedipus TaxID=9490 RepID=A0ABQ9U4Q9_SAGOE|nr:hypothetical protein P7K49_031054 [Saguinus oedipus]
MDTISKESIDLSFVVSGDVSSVTSTTDSQMSMDTSSKLSIEAPSKMHLKTVPKKSETDQQALNCVAKEHLSSYGECHTWSFSPANVCAPPSPVSSKSQIRKNQLLSPLLKQSKQSADPSLPCKMPLQWCQFVQSESSTDKNKKESQSGSTEEEEKQQEEMQPRDLCDTCISSDRVVKKSKDVEKKEAELLEAEEFLKPEDGQQQKETEEKKGWPDQEDQETPLQEGDTKIKAQGQADKCKKEHDRITIEEIIEWMRKTDVNASKVTETPCHDTYEEAEATSEKSDTDSLNEMFPSGTLNGKDPSSKLKKSIKNIKKMPPKLVLLQDINIQVHTEPKTYFNSDLKTFKPKSMKDTSTPEVISRPSTKRMTSCTTKTRKADETNTTNRSSPQRNSGACHDIFPKSPDTFRR